MSYPNSLEDIIGGAAQGGWEWFDQIPAGPMRDKVRLELDKQGEDAATIASAWAAFSLTPGGRMALEALFNTTLRRNSFFVTMGMEPGQVAMWGAFREGQNALAQAIAKQIAKGLGNEQPKPRDAQ